MRFVELSAEDPDLTAPSDRDLLFTNGILVRFIQVSWNTADFVKAQNDIINVVTKC